MLFIDFYSRVHGNAVFSSIFIPKGEIVHVLSGPISTTRTKYTIEIFDNQHILDEYGKYMNHSSTPTVMIQNIHVVALRDIMPGEEICFDYNHSESEISCPFVDNDTGKKVVGKNLLS